MDSLPPSVVLLAGPRLLGFFFDWALQGVLSVQVYIYHLLYPQDSLATNLLVYGTFVFEWVQTALLTQSAFEIDVYDFGNVDSLTAFHNTWFSVNVMSAIIAAVVQAFFCWRIRVLSRSRLLAGVILFFSFCQMCVGFAGGGVLQEAGAIETSVVRPIIVTWLICAAVLDAVIAACMTYYLLRAKSGIKRSDAVVNRLVRLVIETGTLTATMAIVNVVCMLASPKTLLYQCPALVQAKLYANALVVSLNNRAGMRRGGFVDIDDDGSEIHTLPPFPSLAIPPRTAGVHPRVLHHSSHIHTAVAREEYVLRDVHDIVLRDMGSECKGEEVLDIAARDSDTLADGSNV